MNPIDWIINGLDPVKGAARAKARALTRAWMNYDAATYGNRASSWRASASDADQAGARRNRLAYVSRDMIRNTPFATRAQSVITNNVVGDGIIPKVVGGTEKVRAELLDLIAQHCDTVAIDADGRNNLYGLQRLVMNAIVDSGEVLIRRRFRQRSDGLPLALQLQVLESDYIDSTRNGILGEANDVREGIEYDQIGRRVAYWLYTRHPGGIWHRGQTLVSRRVPASEILHIYRSDRPGQMRGVSWFAPAALALQDMADHQDAQLMRQKIAACFAAFRTNVDADAAIGEAAMQNRETTITPGTIRDLAPGEEISFVTPPGVEAYDEFTKWVLRSTAAGLGITYEALSGDLSSVNFSSARMGRMEMDRNISSWQWLMLIPQMMQPIGRWLIEAWALERMRRTAPDLRLDWVPPHRILIDPAKEIGALRDKVRAGFSSRQSVVRELGYDPEHLLAEQIEDAKVADAANLKFDSDARVATAGQPANQPQAAPEQTPPAKTEINMEADDAE